MRPVHTGVRQDDGFAKWPRSTTKAATIYKDDVKVIKHGLEELFGPGVEVHQALHTLGAERDHSIPSSLFDRLQRRDTDDVHFERLRPGTFALGEFCQNQPR